ncbi:hypothetical protein INS49_003165 [Diaporthe citri]|uniref:uncharacterized protein n=1 Tax=Diaporthe citri TaxID=83186 RepID=UPI001C801659|nr:uncharacterized protein INS49_003165 [Diaporthe citri]KAG6368947.1 hypothetical protein INS49_003165 [Diaporthe citri]
MLFSIPIVLTFVAGALAGGYGPPPPRNCLNKTGVDTLVNGYTYLLEHPLGPDFNSTAEAILSDKFQVLSDSILTLSQRPLGQPAYPSKQAYIDSQAQTPPLPVVDTLGVFNTCDKISWRWRATGIGSNQFEINGIINFDVNPETVQIDTVYSEFNTAAFQADRGFPECQQGGSNGSAV